MTYKVLVELGLNGIISEAYAQTQTGNEILTKYRSYLMANQESCGIVNALVRECANCTYDNGINELLGTLSEYIKENKTSWALASACESINNSQQSYNMLNRNAARQVEKLLEQNEENVVKYVRAGALKNVMFCESFRNIAKAVFNDQPIIEHKAEYSKITPVSIVENTQDGYCFVVDGRLFKTTNDGNVMEANWAEVSNSFKTIAQLLQSNLVTVDENKLVINYSNKSYEISEECVVKFDEKEMTVEQFRDYSSLVVMASNPRHKNQVAGVMEAIALTAENYDSIVSLDHAAVYYTKENRFVVIESNENLYATLISSTRHPAWTINEDAIKTLSFIKTKTNVELNEEYGKAVNEAIEKADEQHREELEKQLNENQILSIKERIELLTERFKNDPAKLAVISKLANEVATI